MHYLGGFYVLSMTGFLLFAMWLIISPYGDIRLGPDDSRPDFSRASWFAMLFSAGMGIGLLFFSVAEPIMHFASPPFGEGGTPGAARQAMGLTLFHWRLHPWGVYAVVGLSLAYFHFRRGQPLSIRGAFYPLLGERIHGPAGDAVDILAIVSTLFGVAEEGRSWLASWTVFYWAWWIAWAPFVGMFIATICRGRTIREFMTAVPLAPTLVGFVWFTVFGGAALHHELYGAGGMSEAVAQSIPTAIFVLLDQGPLSMLASIACTLCIVLCFVTSSDSASLVIDTLASGGNTESSAATRVFWAVLEGVVAATLLFAGGLAALQAAAISTALPFCVLIVGMCVALVKGLGEEAL